LPLAQFKPSTFDPGEAIGGIAVDERKPCQPMSEAWSFASVIGLWLAISCGLWWLHRRRKRLRQHRQLEQARRAVACVHEAQAVFDTIRSPASDEPPSRVAGLSNAETYALLKRIQEHGSFFDKVKTLLVKLQASLGIEDYQPLSELLHLRRDLWAASEIILAEDPNSFGEAFAKEGAYERFRSEALRVLFKQKSGEPSDEDPIDLRLSLASEEADRFAERLEVSIRIAREKDRLPTVSEIVAYPLALLRAIPGKLQIAYAFLKALFGYASETAHKIRQSEAVARGAAQLRRAREDWPQRLSAGFEKASATARESRDRLRRHYDFLAAAHDFQSKYRELARRVRVITERGRQFIARLELAERAERLRLPPANAAVWAARRLVDGLAHLIAGLQALYATLRQTALGMLVARITRPPPTSGRRMLSFRSCRMALPGSRPEGASAPASDKTAIGEAASTGKNKTGQSVNSALVRNAKSGHDRKAISPPTPRPKTKKKKTRKKKTAKTMKKKHQPTVTQTNAKSARSQRPAKTGVTSVEQDTRM
jgi:hypothetical protein